MEEYTSNNNELRENTCFLYSPSTTTPHPSDSSSLGGLIGRTNNSYHPHQASINTFHLQSNGGGGSSNQHHHHHHHHHPHHNIFQLNHVKIEGSNNSSSQQQLHTPTLEYHPLLMRGNLLTMHQHHHELHHQGGNNSNNNNNESSDGVEAIKAKIIAHPHYSNLLQAYLDCQKVGAPPEVVARLAAARQEFEARQRSSINSARESSKDPELDQFMEAYYDMLVKYREELTRPMQEAMEFMRRIETQLNMLSDGPLRIFSDGKCEGGGSSEEDQNNSGGETETELPGIDPRAEDRELKNHLLRKYSGYLSSLKQELSKKKKKGKLPKEARQKLLNWWELHYKWPYPSESEKVALAESTGLDQKQINNWFINQRKRHWKPSEDMQFMVMDGLHAHHNATLYMDAHNYMPDHHHAHHYRLGP